MKTKELIEIGVRNRGRWPLGNNPEMDQHAAEQGLAHWSCVNESDNLLWMRVDGLFLRPFELCPGAGYPDTLRKQDILGPVQPRRKLRLGWSDLRGGEHRWRWKAEVWCWGQRLQAWLMRPLPPLVWEWRDEWTVPRWWMGLAFVSCPRCQGLFVVWPLHYVVMLAWWVQDWWARKTKRAECSWVEREVRARMKRRAR